MTTTDPGSGGAPSAGAPSSTPARSGGSPTDVGGGGLGGGNDATQASPRTGSPDVRDSLFGDVREPRVFAEGKFQNVDDLEKAYLSLDKLYNGKADKLIDEMPDEILLQKGMARGLYHAAPEAYENLGQMLTEAGMEPFEEGHEAYDRFTTEAREANFRQKQLGVVMNWLREYNEGVKAQVGILPDRHLREAELLEAWGADAKPRAAEIGKWAMRNMDPELWRAPLMRTAKGMKTLYAWMTRKRDQAPLTKTDRPADTSWSIEGIEEEIGKIMSGDAFNKPLHKDHKAANQKVLDLIARQERLKRQ